MPVIIEILRFCKRQWFVLPAVIPALVLFTLFHEAAHAAAVLLQGGHNRCSALCDVAGGVNILIARYCLGDLRGDLFGWIIDTCAGKYLQVDLPWV